MRLSSFVPAVALLLLCEASVADIISVPEGQSIQGGINRAKPGDTVEVAPGLYKEDIFIDKDGIKLIGLTVAGKRPIIDGEGARHDGVIAAAHNVTIQGLHIRNFLGNGIMTQGGNNFTIVDNQVEGKGESYGIFPQFGKNGLIAHNILANVGSAVYVGMSEHIDVLYNESYGNFYGLELENSSDVLVEGNYVHDNSTGVVVHLVPGLPTKIARRTIVRNNFIINNSRPEKKVDATTNPPEADEGIDVGVGLRVTAADDTIVEGNVIENNPSAAILVMDHHAALRFVVPDPKEDPFPDRNSFVHNIFVNNGASPIGYLKSVVTGLGQTTAPDLLVLGRGKGNCVDNRKSIAMMGDVDWHECPQTTSAGIQTKRLATPVKAPDLSIEQKGRLTYLAVCSGCHSFNNRIYGPPMVAARAAYMGNPEKLAEWIEHPQKRRADYPPMPPQSYLPADVRMAVARDVLQDLKQ